MIILQYAAFLLPNIKICDYLHHVIRSIYRGRPQEEELLARNFVQIGSGYYWTPYIIMIAAVICIPVFLIVTVVSYCKREA